MTIRLEGLDHVALVVCDRARSIAWYRNVLGLEQVYEEKWDGMPAMLVAPPSRTGIALFPADPPQSGGPPPGTAHVAHVAFRTDRTGFEAAQRLLDNQEIPFTFQDHDVSHSIYFVDPDGYRLEITTYDLPEP